MSAKVLRVKPGTTMFAVLVLIPAVCIVTLAGHSETVRGFIR